jgi:hypothetical protein
MEVKMKVKRISSTNEWKVVYFKDGVYDEASSYYTNLRDDAIRTMKSMASRLLVVFNMKLIYETNKETLLVS